MHSQAISRNQLPRLPWVVLLFGERTKLVGYPETIDVPTVHLETACNVRTACIRLLEGYGWATFSDMARIVAAQSDSLNELDRFWSLDVYLMNNHARATGERIVRAKIMDVLPESHNAHQFT